MNSKCCKTCKESITDYPCGHGGYICMYGGSQYFTDSVSPSFTCDMWRGQTEPLTRKPRVSTNKKGIKLAMKLGRWCNARACEDCVFFDIFGMECDIIMGKLQETELRRLL